MPNSIYISAFIAMMWSRGTLRLLKKVNHQTGANLGGPAGPPTPGTLKNPLGRRGPGCIKVHMMKRTFVVDLLRGLRGRNFGRRGHGDGIDVGLGVAERRAILHGLLEKLVLDLYRCVLYVCMYVCMYVMYVCKNVNVSM